MIRLLLPLFLVLGACTAVQETTDKAGRDAARSIMPQTLAVYFPQIPKELYPAFTNCVIENAAAADVQVLAGDAVVGVRPSTGERVRQVIGYPETQDCLRTVVPSADLPVIE